MSFPLNLRHANGSVTLNLDAQAVTDIQRNAQNKAARLVFWQEGRGRKVMQAYRT